MTEAPDPEIHEDESMDDLADGSRDPMATGDPRVDAVLGDLDALHELPVGEHAPVFERAHDRLREALDPDRGSV